MRKKASDLSFHFRCMWLIASSIPLSRRVPQQKPNRSDAEGDNGKFDRKDRGRSARTCNREENRKIRVRRLVSSLH